VTAASATRTSIRRPISRRSATIQLVVVLVAGLVAIFAAGDGPQQQVVVLTLIFVTFGCAWNLIGGFAGQFAFGHAAFFWIGSYTATLLTIDLGIPPLYGMFVGAAIAAVVAAVIGVITLRLRGLYFGLITVVFPVVFSVFATYFGLQEVPVEFHPDGGLDYFSPGDPRVLGFVALAAAFLVLLVTVWLSRSRIGLQWSAVKADQDAAEAAGVATARAKVVAMVLSAAFSAIAGTLYASAVVVVTPPDVFGLTMSVEPVLFSVFGGIGVLLGPVIGAAVLVPLSQTLTAQFGSSFPSLSGLLYGVVLLVVIVLLPSGVVPALVRLVRRRTDRRVTAAPAAPVTLFEPPVERAPGATILSIEHIRKSFGGTKVLEDVDFAIHQHEIVGVIGPNGAGKTTLFNLINGFLTPDSGQAVLQGKTISGLRPHRIARLGVGRTFQTARPFSGLTVAENVLVPASIRYPTMAAATTATFAALDDVGLLDRAEDRMSELTNGELRRLEFARAVAGAPELLLLDEFLGGLSGADADVLLDAIRRWVGRGGSVLAIEHTMRSMIGFVDRFVVLNFGQVIANGTGAEISADPQVIEAYLGEKWASHARS
jgi:ABC-type branched-subunit amino acid transport system ATPase component/ABC-type branched-subunit amino acid transport system permease subunit